MWISRLTLTDFRNHAHVSLVLDARPIVLAGPNGAGKTNVLEAVSLLAAGQGMRRAAYPELVRIGGDGGWAVAATLQTQSAPIDIGTGLQAAPATAERAVGRIVRLNGEPQSGSGVLFKTAAPIPEPQTWVLMAGGLLLLGSTLARRSRPA